MLYEHIETKEFGITHEMLLRLLPNTSFPVGISEIGKYKKYEKVDRPVVSETQTVVEVAPVNGVQTWLVSDKEESLSYIASLKTSMKAKITEKRWAVESGGLSFPNGVSVKTAKDDQDRILAVIINAERNGIEEIDFKADSGWVKISLFALKQLAKELTYFVQNCFKTEKYHHGYIDSLSNANEICNYNYQTGWSYSPSTESTEVINFYTMALNDVITLLYSNFIFPKIENNILSVTKDKFLDAQALVDKTFYGMKDLTPSQFYYLLAKSGLDNAIQVLLPPLKTEDLNKYSKYKSFLYGARFYEFSKALHMYNDIKPKILTVNSELNFTIEQLKTLWEEAKGVEV